MSQSLQEPAEHLFNQIKRAQTCRWLACVSFILKMVHTKHVWFCKKLTSKYWPVTDLASFNATPFTPELLRNSSMYSRVTMEQTHLLQISLMRMWIMWHSYLFFTDIPVLVTINSRWSCGWYLFGEDTIYTIDAQLIDRWID